MNCEIFQAGKLGVASIIPPAPPKKNKKRERMGNRRMGKKNRDEKDKGKRRRRRNTSRKQTKVQSSDICSFGHFSEVKAKFIQGKEMFTG